MHGDFTKLELFTNYYDTLYGLMDSLSPRYRDRFNEKVAEKLEMLQVVILFVLFFFFFLVELLR